jgi:catechol 2,3-dioxygenase-like lactoylglutathione lyase family enzyme
MQRLAAVLIVLTGFGAVSLAQEAPYHDPGMKNIVQVAIVCKDVEASARRWAQVLGVAPPSIKLTRPGHEVKVMYRGKPSEGQIKMAILNTGQAALELMQPVGGDTSWREHLDQHGESVQHIAFRVVDLERTIKALDALGMPALHRGRFDGDNGDYVYVDSQKALGVTIELLHSDPPKP